MLVTHGRNITEERIIKYEDGSLRFNAESDKLQKQNFPIYF